MVKNSEHKNGYATRRTDEKERAKWERKKKLKEQSEKDVAINNNGYAIKIYGSVGEMRDSD